MRSHRPALTITVVLLMLTPLYTISLFLSGSLELMLLAETENKDNIFFDYEDFGLSIQAKKLLDFYAKELINITDSRLNITGYSDKKGNPEYNKKLSEKRVKSVVDYLLSKNINKGKLKTTSLGSTKKFSSGDSQNSLRLNRRVEIVLIIPDKESVDANIKKSENINKIFVEKNRTTSIDMKSIIEHELKKVAPENIDFSIPAEMKKGEKQVIYAEVSNSLIRSLLSRLKNNTYKKLGVLSPLRLEGFLLEGNNFKIEIIQSQTENNRWVWEISPNKTGIQSVTLVTLIGVGTNNRDENVYTIPLYLKTIDVKNKSLYILSDIYKKVLYIIFIILIALGIFTMISKKNKRDNKKKA